MLDNYLSLAMEHFQKEYPDTRIEVCYLECIDCFIYGDIPKSPFTATDHQFVNQYNNHVNTDIFVFVGLPDDADIFENMFKAISYSIECKVPCEIAFIENDRALAFVTDYTVKPIHSTPCMHIALTFTKLISKLESDISYRECINEVMSYFKLPETCYICKDFIEEITDDAIEVNVYVERKGSLHKRNVSY